MRRLSFALQRVRFAAAMIAASGVCGCAIYRPAPLNPAPQAADLAAGAVEAQHLSHPRLAPLSIDPSQPLTPDRIAVLAVVMNPDLKAARAAAKVAQAQVFAAGLLPDPSLSASYDHILSGPDSHDATGFQIAFDLNALREHGVSLAEAKAARDQVRDDVAWREWQTAGQAEILAARCIGLEQGASLSRDAERLTSDALARTLAAAARGDVRGDEVQARRIAAAEAADRARQSERAARAARQDLNALLGLGPNASLKLAAGPGPSAVPAFEAASALALTARLDLRALRSGYAAQEAAMRKAVMDQFPNLQLSINRSADTTGNQTLGPSVNFTLPVWDRNRGGIAVAKATREQLRAEYAARLIQTRADVAALIEDLNILDRQRQNLEAQMPGLEALAAADESAAQAGDQPFSAAEAARLAVIDKQIALAGLRQAQAEQAAALEIAIGTRRAVPSAQGRDPS